VVRIFKKIYASDAAMDEPLSRHGLEELSDFDISAIRLQVEAILKEKIVLTYLARGKVTRAEAEAMFLAMQDQFEDWIMTQDSESSMYKRVKKQLDISEHQYEATLRTKMEYLLKMAREEFGSRLMKDL
jgi:hypothetical protein